MNNITETTPYQPLPYQYKCRQKRKSETTEKTSGQLKKMQIMQEEREKAQESYSPVERPSTSYGSSHRNSLSFPPVHHPRSSHSYRYDFQEPSITPLEIQEMRNLAEAVTLPPKTRVESEKEKIVKLLEGHETKNNLEALFHLARAEEFTFKDNFELAKPELERALALKPSIYIKAHIYLHRALIEQKLQRFETAMIAVDAGLELNPPSTVREQLNTQLQEIQCNINRVQKENNQRPALENSRQPPKHKVYIPPTFNEQVDSFPASPLPLTLDSPVTLDSMERLYRAASDEFLLNY